MRGLAPPSAATAAHPRASRARAAWPRRPRAAPTSRAGLSAAACTTPRSTLGPPTRKSRPEV
eukprot:4263688-Prymnesium_polylepis.1